MYTVAPGARIRNPEWPSHSTASMSMGGKYRHGGDGRELL
jgi:hypothetical protein